MIQNGLVDKPCTVVKMLWGYNTVLCNELLEIKSLLLDNSPMKSEFVRNI